ncbi:DDE-type integrase/transposase/recombinase [Salibacterium qingdaonense]|uniref:Helix-turn-helix domain-containing protein n=1 Tax=Salibacterium qingdaonense TaxID=266892 RepID=A0A1I4N8L2_9BACI|nr:DDE-type integrase/transposase/recombinase [Salibacterium qingdaonense]SFM11851.1 Helix-turn-helix domain-containing protein [Salibacterium qingdaonense]
MSSHEKAEAVAAERMEVIAPLVERGLDSAEMMERRRRISKESGWSDRTLRRYVQAYQEQGFTGLKPKGNGRKGRRVIPETVLEQAVYLRREVPSRSVAQIIQVLEWEGYLQPGEIKRSTLQEQLTKRGYSSRHMRLYQDPGVAARRFQHQHRNQLWHSDIKYGPYLPIGPNGDKKQVYLVAFLDDATRFLIHGMFYPILDQSIIETGFRRAVNAYGVPERVYFDNGKQYRTKWMKRTCAKLGIRLLYAKPYSPESTGKVERFNRNVDAFLEEVRLDPPESLDVLNRRFYAWSQQCYQQRPHSALPEERTPEVAFQKDPQPIHFEDVETITNAFLHSTSRKVDKAGCISFQGTLYEVGLSFIGSQVDVVFDPADVTTLMIEYADYEPWQATEVVIGRKAGARPKRPEGQTKQETTRSRVLEAAEQAEAEKQKAQRPVISYIAAEGGDSRV